MRKILIFCVSLGVLVLALLLGPEHYRKWRAERAFHNAGAALARNRDREALLSLWEALQSDPGNVPATRLMAGILEKQKSPAAVLWNRRLSQLSPGEVEPRLAWLRGALGLRDAAMAAAALESFPENQRRGALFHHLASSEALLRKDWAQAEFHASEAVRLDPDNPVLELNLASVRLQSGYPAVVAQAQAMLAALQKKEKSSVAATRVLITDALRRRDFARAAELSRILLPSSSAGFDDRLQFLSALDGTGSPETGTVLRELQTEAGSDTWKSVRLLEWLLGHQRAGEARSFIRQLPPALLENPSVRVLRASADAAQGQWEALEQRLQSENWEDNDYLRQAFAARALKETRQEGAARTEWNGACRSASKIPHGFYILASTTQAWPNWEDETRELMWMIAGGYRYPVWALGRLHGYYLSKGDTRALLRVAKRWKEVQASDPVLNNFAQYSLLLNQDLTLATAIARKNSDNHPGDPGYASTYAFALNRTGKNTEALEVMSRLKPEAWRIPELCFYQAVFLAQAGRREEAEAFRKKAEGAALLPEEKELWEKAFSKL